mmetsp:Transcript_82312/g.232979  ORF Transcript_82312/g.232979 Transcript_82312/m.232979 type:complete len:86 (-) Transcript_82312:109-366(-)
MPKARVYQEAALKHAVFSNMPVFSNFSNQEAALLPPPARSVTALPPSYRAFCVSPPLPKLGKLFNTRRETRQAMRKSADAANIAA